MKTQQMREKTLSELNASLLVLHKEQFNLKMQKATGQLSKPDLIKKNRKEIARTNTIISEKGKGNGNS